MRNGRDSDQRVRLPERGWPPGNNTVGFVLSQSDDRREALKWLGIDAIAPLLGAIVGSALTLSEEGLGYLLAAYAGFLYMGATDLLPEAHRHHSWLRVSLTAIGFVAIFGVSLLVH
jgi:ZIP family zinc transporter